MRSQLKLQRLTRRWYSRFNQEMLRHDESLTIAIFLDDDDDDRHQSFVQSHSQQSNSSMSNEPKSLFKQNRLNLKRIYSNSMRDLTI